MAENVYCVASTTKSNDAMTSMTEETLTSGDGNPNHDEVEHVSLSNKSYFIFGFLK